MQMASVKQKPVTTVFVGNISDKCSNEFMQQMLQVLLTELVPALLRDCVLKQLCPTSGSFLF